MKKSFLFHSIKSWKKYLGDQGLDEDFVNHQITGK